jgi:hypothetical protein
MSLTITLDPHSRRGREFPQTNRKPSGPGIRATFPSGPTSWVPLLAEPTTTALYHHLLAHLLVRDALRFFDVALALHAVS